MLEELKNFIEDEMMTDEELREAVADSENWLKVASTKYNKNYAPALRGRRTLKELIKKGYAEYKEPVIEDGVRQEELFFTYAE